MLRARIHISRTSVRRILEEELHSPNGHTRRSSVLTPRDDNQCAQQLLNPTAPNEVWHIDVTEVRVLWRRVEVAAVLDGHSRKVLALKAFAHRPRSSDVLALIGEAIRSERTAPRFLISDHGSQFGHQFGAGLERWGIKHVRGKVGVWQINAKIEQFFSTLKHWQRRTWITPRQQTVQERLDEFTSWYNSHRPHAALGSRTPAEGAGLTACRKPVLYLVKGGTDPAITVKRNNYMHDPCLPLLEIRVRAGPIAA